MKEPKNRIWKWMVLFFLTWHEHVGVFARGSTSIRLTPKLFAALFIHVQTFSLLDSPMASSGYGKCHISQIYIHLVFLRANIFPCH
jgi:hypothetical protein